MSGAPGPRRLMSKGSALVEGAMVMSLFLMLTVSVVDLGHFLHQQQALAEQTRAGLRAGVVRSLTPEQIAAMVVFSRPQIPAGATQGFQGLKMENVSVRVLDPGTADARIVVSIHGLKYSGMTPFLASAIGPLKLRMSSPLEMP